MKKKKVTFVEGKKFIPGKPGWSVEYKLQEKPDMPARYPDDHPIVSYLVSESERLSALGARWENAKVPNPKGAALAYENGWALALAAAHLRCYLKGELLKKPPTTKKKK